MNWERGFVLQPTYRVRSGVPVVQLWGRLETGRAFVVEDDRFRPYFFVHEQHQGLLADEANVSVTPVELVDLSGRPVVRVETKVPGDVPELRRRLEARGAEPLEADIRFAYRYLIDRGLRAAISIEGEPEREDGHLVRYRNPELAPADYRPELRVLSLDIETLPDASRVLSVALVGPGVEAVHVVSETPLEHALTYEDEGALLRGVIWHLRDLDPDVITGWNVVDFDMRVLARRCEAHRIAFTIGRSDERLSFQRDMSFSRQSRVDVPGRQVLDGQGLVRDASISLDDYRLETASRQILGRGKKIAHAGDGRGQEIERMYKEDRAAFVAYNREDARLVLDILDKEGLLDLAVERSLLSGMQLDRVGASIASFDLLYLPELRRRGFVAPCVDSTRKSAGVAGGAVLDSKPGIFSNVAVFDFKSLYPSLIRTFNLDPLAHARAGDDAIEAPNGARFSREEAILPAIIERFMASREHARQRGERHADQAIKIMMNAFFGVLGAASCRFFDPDVANAITSFGQQTLHWTREAFEASEVGVLYGDTDSVFIQLRSASDAAARDEAAELRERVEARVAARIRDAYRVEPRLHLELERIFARFFMPRVRGGKSGSKKRYAGLHDGELTIVGLESVRRDWPAVARRLQRGMLERAFADRDVMPFVREIVAGVRSGDLDTELVYRKRVRKRSIDSYTATTPPHIQAARKAGGAVGPVVRYVVTASGPEPVLPGHPLPSAIDHAHYIERVLRPVAQAILSPLEQHFDEALDRPRQLSLL